MEKGGRSLARLSPSPAALRASASQPCGRRGEIPSPSQALDSTGNGIGIASRIRWHARDVRRRATTAVVRHAVVTVVSTFSPSIRDLVALLSRLISAVLGRSGTVFSFWLSIYLGAKHERLSRCSSVVCVCVRSRLKAAVAVAGLAPIRAGLARTLQGWHAGNLPGARPVPYAWDVQSSNGPVRESCESRPDRLRRWQPRIAAGCLHRRRVPGNHTLRAGSQRSRRNRTYLRGPHRRQPVVLGGQFVRATWHGDHGPNQHPNPRRGNNLELG
jgi:hypothetical protein